MVKVVSEVSEIPSTGSVVIDFYATWCGPCKVIAPTFEKLAETYPELTCLKVDVDESQELVDIYDISCMPTFIFLKDGQVVKKVEGGDMKGLETGFNMLSK
jgi:thioredoxin 1